MISRILMGQMYGLGVPVHALKLMICCRILNTHWQSLPLYLTTPIDIFLFTCFLGGTQLGLSAVGRSDSSFLIKSKRLKICEFVIRVTCPYCLFLWVPFPLPTLTRSFSKRKWLYIVVDIQTLGSNFFTLFFFFLNHFGVIYIFGKSCVIKKDQQLVIKRDGTK